MLRPIPAATNALSSFPQVFSCVSPWRANQKLIFWVNCTGLFLIMNFNKNCGTHERIKILPGHSSCQQCTFVVPAGFSCVSPWRPNQKLILRVNCTGLFLVWNFFQELWNHKRIKILPGNRSKYFATDISGGSGISRFILQAKFAVSLSFADEVGCKVIFSLICSGCAVICWYSSISSRFGLQKVYGNSKNHYLIWESTTHVAHRFQNPTRRFIFDGNMDWNFAFSGYSILFAATSQ